MLSLWCVTGLAFAKYTNPQTGAVPSVQPKHSGAARRESPASKMMTMEVNQAIMITVELDFGKKVPGIAEALAEIRRLYQADDGRGRTFSIIDAYGEPTPGGKLHLSMHVSTEKLGTGGLVFRRTGEILWQSKIVPSKKPDASTFTGKNLTIYIDDGKGETFQVDGSGNPASILEAKLKGSGKPVTSFWPDSARREVSFVYSACGCPVKVMVRRLGDRTARTSDQPVIFPDDPAAAQTISRLMRW